MHGCQTLESTRRLLRVYTNDDAQSEEDLDDNDGDGDESDDIYGDDPIRGLDMLL